MNGVATNIIHLQHRKLKYYGGGKPARPYGLLLSYLCKICHMASLGLIMSQPRLQPEVACVHAVASFNKKKPCDDRQATTTRMCGRGQNWRRTR